MAELCKICGKELAKVTECAWTNCPKVLADWADEKELDAKANGGEAV